MHITAAEANLAEIEKGDGKGSPLTLIGGNQKNKKRFSR